MTTTYYRIDLRCTICGLIAFQFAPDGTWINWGNQVLFHARLHETRGIPEGEMYEQAADLE